MSLVGVYQSENVAAAVAALDALRLRGVPLEDECLAHGLAHTCWPGRLQVLARHPLLLLDGAHNPASMRRLAESVALLQRGNDIVFVLGFSGDKDVRGAVRELLHLGGRVVLSVSSQPRALPPRDMAVCIADLGLDAVCESDPNMALWRARSMVDAAGMVVVSGSLYLVGEVLGGWLNDKQSPMRWVSVPGVMTRRAGR